MSAWLTIGTVIYAFGALAAFPIIELSLIGSRWNKPWILFVLGAIYPISYVGILIRDALRAK